MAYPRDMICKTHGSVVMADQAGRNGERQVWYGTGKGESKTRLVSLRGFPLRLLRRCKF